MGVKATHGNSGVCGPLLLLLLLALVPSVLVLVLVLLLLPEKGDDASLFLGNKTRGGAVCFRKMSRACAKGKVVVVVLLLLLLFEVVVPYKRPSSSGAWRN